MRPEELADTIRRRLPDTLLARGEVTVSVDRGRLLETLGWLRDDPEMAFGSLMSVTATDWPGRDPRFWVVYELRSLEKRQRVRVKTGLSENDPRLTSVSTMFHTANFHERETYDFFGIDFEGHPDLTRILLPDGWEGFPLRKTEELGGVNTRYRGAFIPPVDKRVT
jgi:NADH-quinone oxidoreductase subunit C